MAVSFTGSQYARRASNLLNLTSGKEFTLSLWLKAEDGQGGTIFIGGGPAGATQKISVTQSTSSGVYSVLLRNAADTIIWQASTATAYDDGEWHNVLISADLAATTAHLFVDGVSDESTIVAPVNDTIAWADCTEWVFGAFFAGGATLLTAIVDSLWFATEYIDVSTAANKRFFYGDDGTKVGLGHQGRRPIARRPEVLLCHGPGNFGHNEGSGGDFTLTGSLSFDRGRPATVNSLSRGFRGEAWRESERSGIPFPESELVTEPASGLEVARREFSTDRDEINRLRRRRAFPE
jgi:hypothetical protein